MERLLTTREAAGRAGVGPTAIKRWADLGLLPCVKTAGGHRRFKEGSLAAFLRERTPAEERSEADTFVDLLLDAQSGHEVEARLLLLRGSEGAWYRAAPRIGEVLVRIGARWERGEISVIDEHLASERLLRALTRISEGMPVAPDAPLALLTSVEGDDHVLGLALVELCLREGGLRTRWVGRATPARELAKFVEDGEVEMVAVSASSVSSDRRQLDRYTRRIAAACEAHGVQLLLGGEGAWPASPRYGVRLRSFDELRGFLAGRRPA